MQIEQKDKQWILTPETQREEDVLCLIVPLIKRFCPEFLMWLNSVIGYAEQSLAHDLKRRRTKLVV